MSAVEGQHLHANPQWLARRTEVALEASQPIIDAHHHVWDAARQPSYGLTDLLVDFDAGHNVLASVFVECRAMYRSAGPKAYRSVGETEYANGLAAMSASGLFGRTRVASAIIAHIDLTQGDEVAPVLDAHKAVGGGRLSGVRDIAAYDPSPGIRVSGPVPQPRKLADLRFRQGFAHLAKNALTFDAWVYHPQLTDVAALAQAFPDTAIALNHCGGPIRIGPYAEKPAESFAHWREGIRRAARCQNMFVKLGGLGMKIGGWNFQSAALPPSSDQLADAWRPYVLECIDAFTPSRCMFESNFPVEKGSCSYGVLWNSFKRMTRSYSTTEKNALFYGTAAHFYRITDATIGERTAINEGGSHEGNA